MTMKKLFHLEDYDISPKTGCLVDDVQSELPPYFEPWEKIAKSLVKLYTNKTLRDEVHKLELLDHTKLKGHKELFLAHAELAFMSSAYVWQDGDAGVSKLLPKCLAVPLYEISRQLGVKPIVSHLDVCLANCYLVDPNGPKELSNLKCVLEIPGGRQGQHFCLVTGLVELQFAKCLKPLVSALNLLLQGEENKALGKEGEDVLMAHLESICGFIGDMKKALMEMNDGLEPDTFFNVIRPILAGWKGNTSALPNGLIYEGISEDPIQILGGSAAQSASLQALDAVFGVIHTEDAKKFLTDMRSYMPPRHARFIEDLQQCPVQLALYVKSVASPGVQHAYNKCVAAIVQFRAVHMNIVSKYIVRPSRECNRQNYEKLNEAGTGGTDLIPFLSGLRSVTRKTILYPKPYSQPLPGISFYALAVMACVIPIVVAVYTFKLNDFSWGI